MHPQVIVKEIDQSTYVPSFPGLYAGIVIPALKGEKGKPIFVTSDTELLKYFTPDETVKVGYNMAFYSALAFLQKSNKLWVVRADNGSLYGGAVAQTVTGTAKSLKDVQLGAVTVIDVPTKKLTLGTLVEGIGAGDSIIVGADVATGKKCKVVSVGIDTNKTTITVADVTGITVANKVFASGLVKPENYGFADAKDALLITGTNEGAWNNDIAIKLFTYEKSPDLVKEPDAFQIQVYKISTGDLLDSITASRHLGAKDGYGNNIYIEDVVKASNYISAIDNRLIAENVELKEILELLPLTGGADGDAVTDTEMIASLQLLKNKNEVPLAVIMDGGWSTIAYQKAIDGVCQSRTDCVGILSTPYSAESTTTATTDIITYRKTTLNMNSSYCALYTPHLLIQDNYNNRTIYASPDGYAAAQIADTASNYEIWYAPAGFKRGALNVLDTKKRFTDGELDLLYDAGVNPVKYAPGKGIAVFGQKTLSSRPSALDRLNVRLLLVTIEPAINEFLQDFLFEFNDELTRLLISSGISSYMDNIKARNGVYAYTIVCDETNNTADVIDNNELNVWLYVQPTKVAEFITLSVVITRTGYQVSVK